MTATATALNAFFSGFGLPAWPEGCVPFEAKLWQARVWTRSLSFEELNRIVSQILGTVGEGVLVPAGSGSICIRPGSPPAQHMPMPGEPEMKVAYLNFQLNSYHMTGE